MTSTFLLNPIYDYDFVLPCFLGADLSDADLRGVDLSLANVTKVLDNLCAQPP